MDIEIPNNEEPQHLPVINGLMQGTVVYFKKCKANIDPAVHKTDDYRFGHYGFGVYFGEIPPGNIAPTRMSVFRTFGNLGLISFDDLTEFLGKEKTAEVIAAWTDKYYGKEVVDPEAGVQAPTPIKAVTPDGSSSAQEPSKIVGIDGKPIDRELIQ